jgi:hypothetical protein
MKKVSLDSASVLSIGLVLVLLSTVQAYAQPLVTSTPPGTTGGINISINPDESLPANGTVSISTEGAIDSDMNAFPPEGVTVLISNETVTVTNQTVDIETADEESSDDEGDGEAGIIGDQGDEQGGGDGDGDGGDGDGDGNGIGDGNGNGDGGGGGFGGGPSVAQ